LYAILYRELKALFLRVRNNTDEMYLIFIKKIYGYDWEKAKRTGILSKSGRIFNDSKDKFNKTMRTLAIKYREINK